MARQPDVDADALAALVQRAFGTSVLVHCERTADGVSTQVYRLVRGPETFCGGTWCWTAAADRFRSCHVDAAP